jgi:hypothetical protein
MKEQSVELAEIPGFPRYTFNSNGEVFKDGIPKVVSCKPGRSAKVIIRINRKMYTLGLAKLIAERFIPNPYKYKRLIFKDRNHHNCTKDNIAWVDEETFFFYCCPTREHRRIVHTQEYAIENAKDIELKHYYMTLDEFWIGEVWKKVNHELSKFSFWPQVMSVVYLYFIDRVKRFSILGNPAALMWYYAKYEFLKQKKEISPYLPYKKLMQSDESLRDVNFDE